MNLPRLLMPTMLFIWLCGLLGGCDRSQTAAPGPQTIVKREIVCAVYPVADIVRQVAGEQTDLRWQIDWFCEDTLDPRDFEITPDQLRKVHDADVVITSGFIDTWATDMLSAQVQAQHVIALDVFLPKGSQFTLGHGDLWLDPQIAMSLTEAIRQRLAEMDDPRQEYYRHRADDYSRQLHELDGDFARRLAPLKGEKFLALRPTWKAMVERYGLEEIDPVNTTPQKLTDEDIERLKRSAKENRTNFLAVEASVLPGIKRELQMRTGLTLLEMDALGTSASEGRSTYIRLMRYNLDQLCQGLK